MTERLAEIEKIFAAGDLDQAVKLLLEFLHEHPGNCRAINDLGIVQQTLGHTEEAIACFKKSLLLEPDNQTSLHNLALSLVTAGYWEEAKEHLSKLLSTNQNDAGLWALMAKAELSSGGKQAAMEYMSKSLMINDQQPQLQQALEKLRQEINKGTGAKDSGKKASLLMCCQSGLESFALSLCQELEKHINIKSVVSYNLGPMTWPIKEAENLWLEWGSQMAREISHNRQMLQGKKKVILRLHSFEILTGMVKEINFAAITDLIFVSNYMRDLFFQKYHGMISGNTRVHVIHNGINLPGFPFKAGRGRSKIAFVGKLDHRKNPMLMLNAFYFLKQQHSDLELHVAGAFDDKREYLSITDWVEKNNFKDNVKFYGHISDIAKWLDDKDFILCTSPFESQGVGLLEAMHRGLRPLICNFPGAEHLYPADCLWNNIFQLSEMISAGADPEACSRFVAEKYSMARQAESFVRVLTTDEAVVEAPPVAALRPGRDDATS